MLGPKLTVKNVDGNHIVLKIGDNAYAFYAHLLKGTLLVKVGDRVRKGQVIARLGNTGNANASHLHFHVMNGPSVLGSSGDPVRDRLVPLPGPDLPAAAGERRRLPHRRLLRPGSSRQARAAHAPAALGVGHRELPRLSSALPPASMSLSVQSLQGVRGVVDEIGGAWGRDAARRGRPRRAVSR